MRVLVTGGAGFIGSHFVRHWLRKYPDSDITVLDKLTYAGRKENLKDLAGEIRFVNGDICEKGDVEEVLSGSEIIFNFAAESHVDRSITDAEPCVTTNVWGTYVLLELARRHGVERFVQVSTDEVYGSRPSGSFNEADSLSPSSPYAATKASADLLALSYFRTHGLPVVVTRSSNNFGPYQYPEKLIPLFILNALENVPVPVYGDGKNVRDWIYVTDNCAAIDLIARHGVPGEAYNVAAKNEKQNLDIASSILKLLEASPDLLEFVPDRPGHDWRYSLDTTKIEQLGWRPVQDFEDCLRQTVSWYRDNEWWWRPLREHAASKPTYHRL